MTPCRKVINAAGFAFPMAPIPHVPYRAAMPYTVRHLENFADLEVFNGMWVCKMRQVQDRGGSSVDGGGGVTFDLGRRKSKMCESLIAVTCSCHVPTSYPHVNKGASASGHSKYLITIRLHMKPVHSPPYADTRLLKVGVLIILTLCGSVFCGQGKWKNGQSASQSAITSDKIERFSPFPGSVAFSCHESLYPSMKSTHLYQPP